MHIPRVLSTKKLKFQYIDRSIVSHSQQSHTPDTTPSASIQKPNVNNNHNSSHTPDPTNMATIHQPRTYTRRPMQRTVTSICTKCKETPGRYFACKPTPSGQKQKVSVCPDTFCICPHCKCEFKNPGKLACLPSNEQQVKCGHCNGLIVEEGTKFHYGGTSTCAKCTKRRHREGRFNCRICKENIVNCEICETEVSEAASQVHDSGIIFCGIDCLYTIETPAFEKCTIKEPYATNSHGYLCDFADKVKDDIRFALNSQKALKMQMAENPASVDVKLDQISKYDPLVEDYRTEVKSFYEEKIQEELGKIEGNIRELEVLREPVVEDRLHPWIFHTMEGNTTHLSLRIRAARERYNEKRLRIIDTTKTDTEILADAVQYAKQLRQQKPT